MHQLIWFRTDLRVHDNPALHAAMGKGPTIALFLLSPGQWQRHDDAPAKIDFWLRNLAELKAALAQLNVPLLVRQADTWDKAPEVIARLCHEQQIAAVSVNDEYGVNEGRRDDAVARRLGEDGIDFNRHLDQLLFAPGSITTREGGYFKVYSQFRKVCHERLHHSMPRPQPRHPAQKPMKLASDDLPDRVKGFTLPDATVRDFWPAGEEVALKRLKHFANDDIGDYERARDVPSEAGTSGLSAYLNAGVLSPRQCLNAVLHVNEGALDSGNAGAVTWANELLWREFYRHILVGYPRVSMHRAFRPETEALDWRYDERELEAWQQGRTGIPIIDAAMRQLLATGWMHNRLRMLTAMFLSKNLLLDWRAGERWFMQHLVDGDLASNNGGWQWSASTGTDSVPYFRIFNPMTQAEKYDPSGEFIREWVPELRDVDTRSIHRGLGDDLFKGVDYPAPMVDLKQSRQRALAAFRNLPRKS